MAEPLSSAPNDTSNDEPTITESSGNVFEDLGFDQEEARNLKIRTRLMVSLRRFIDDSDMTQVEAAELFGVTQPRISDLVNRKVEKFTIDTLVNMHVAAGMDVHIEVDRNGTPA